MSAVIRWEEPPPSRRAGPRRPEDQVNGWTAIAAELKERPGEWAVIYEGSNRSATAVVTNIRYGSVAAFAPGGDFDATCRVRDGVRTVYVRYLGDGGCE